MIELFVSTNTFKNEVKITIKINILGNWNFLVLVVWWIMGLKVVWWGLFRLSPSCFLVPPPLLHESMFSSYTKLKRQRKRERGGTFKWRGFGLLLKERVIMERMLVVQRKLELIQIEELKNSTHATSWAATAFFCSGHWWSPPSAAAAHPVEPLPPHLSFSLTVCICGDRQLVENIRGENDATDRNEK